ncbi:hypothetical protein PR048_003975 [Dryococelus australis]|uniref:Uncharacterized protein n=1 Tax=Dryococelus australis TaxID=614101 RepID=A0ABQ9I488_9NEOP|nr:hypothetical protein PR048_003975 [Dryococelus australis]
MNAGVKTIFKCFPITRHDEVEFVYISEYLPDLVEFFQETDDGGSGTEYFHTRLILSRAANFLVEHCSSLVENIVELEGLMYSLCHKLNSMWDDLESNFLLVNRGIFWGNDFCFTLNI